MTSALAISSNVNSGYHEKLCVGEKLCVDYVMCGREVHSQAFPIMIERGTLTLHCIYLAEMEMEIN